MEKYKCDFCVSYSCVRMYQVNTNLIGANAGKIWETLHQNQSLTQHQLMKKTGLDNERFHQAVGWLSRENKINKDGEFYCLSDSNLDSVIGPVAGVVISVLEDLKESIEGLEHLTRIHADEFNQAVGWLAREGHFQASDDILTIDTDPECLEMQINRLQDEIIDLSDEMVSRNHIISELTRQLTETQNRSIQDIDMIEQLHNKLQSAQKISSTAGSELTVTNDFLKQEIQDLHQELMSRNHIIAELSRQLTNTQTTIITQADKLNRLQTSLVKKPLSSSGTVSESLRNRVHRITELQRSLDANQQNILISESKLYDVESPMLDISKSQFVSEDELREALQVLHQDIDQIIDKKKQVSNRGERC